MIIYIVFICDIQFVLYDMLDILGLDVFGYGDLDCDFIEVVLDVVGKFVFEVLVLLNSVGDWQGCWLENGIVCMFDGFKVVFDQLCEGGWMVLDVDLEYGGQGMFYVIGYFVVELFFGVNMVFVMYLGLIYGVYLVIYVYGIDDQKVIYLFKMVSCDWIGMMNLIELYVGIDLGMLCIKVELQDDGSYLIIGQKIFILVGDYDMFDNVIYLVLVKVFGGGESIKGILLFIVLKFLVNVDGFLGECNVVLVGKLEEKMGIYGNVICVMNYDGVCGWLLGDLYKGMWVMFIMMNEVCIGVGL